MYMQSTIPPAIEASTPFLFYASNRYCGNFKLKIFQLNDVQQQQHTLHVELNAMWCRRACKHHHTYMTLLLCTYIQSIHSEVSIRIPSTNIHYMIQRRNFADTTKFTLNPFPPARKPFIVRTYYHHMRTSIYACGEVDHIERTSLCHHNIPRDLNLSVQSSCK